jgi:excisionase family DNA binding protein
MGKLLTVEEAAAMINRPVATLRYWVLQDTAPKSFKVGRRRMFRESDVEAWIDEKAEASA